MEERMTSAGRVSSSGSATDAPFDRVFVHDLVLDAEIGVYSNEKGVTQRARFSVDIDVKPADAAIEDQIDRVLDYDAIIAGQAFANTSEAVRIQIRKYLASLILFGPDDTASNLQPKNAADPQFPQFGHGSIRLVALFNDQNDPE